MSHGHILKHSSSTRNYIHQMIRHQRPILLSSLNSRVTPYYLKFMKEINVGLGKELKKEVMIEKPILNALSMKN